jgi:hypothetical protein
MPDVKADEPMRYYFQALSRGILTGYEDGSFHPNESITRARQPQSSCG